MIVLSQCEAIRCRLCAIPLRRPESRKYRLKSEPFLPNRVSPRGARVKFGGELPCNTYRFDRPRIRLEIGTMRPIRGFRLYSEMARAGESTEPILARSSRIALNC